VKLVVEPEDGLAPILSSIKTARKSIDLTIFRFDAPLVEKALAAAVARGVAVRALVASRNGGDDKRLRRLEERLLAAGVTVARTDDDLIRYHDKLMIVDGRTACVLAFNFTKLDLRSRSLAVWIRDRKIVHDAVRLFEADATRQPYTSTSDSLVVSPENARARLMAFVRKAHRQLLIYDHKLSDPAMIKLLLERAKAGVEIRILGRLARKGAGLKAVKLSKPRLHLRAIVRDGRRAFVGSQSLRKAELDARRELGVLIRNPKVVKQIVTVFEDDWGRTKAAQDGLAIAGPKPVAKPRRRRESGTGRAADAHAEAPAS
jgi:phosphatidylserine/phosphatidylglycerophosphate/cardiolipin synthase-like enzyme